MRNLIIGILVGVLLVVAMVKLTSPPSSALNYQKALDSGGLQPLN